MENNLENKAKFFAQYLEQRVFNYKQSGGFYTYKVGGYMLEDHNLNLGRLLLKSLSDISDEDAIEVGRLNGSITSNNLLVGKALCHWLRIEGTNRDITFEAIDFLRSKGYLLPFNGLSTEELISRGWAVLTSNHTVNK